MHSVTSFDHDAIYDNDGIFVLVPKPGMWRSIAPNMKGSAKASMFLTIGRDLNGQAGANFDMAPKGLVINYGEGGGGYKMGKSRVRNFLRPPSRQGKTFRAPLLKSGNVLRPPSRQGKTFRTPPFKEWKLYAPPLQYG